ncbi:MAG: hypothetical protein RL198_579, partial [Actinomycetota bacterium]
MARSRLTAAIAAVSLLFGTVLIAPAYAVPDYPTAEEVAEAKQNVRDKQAMIERIEGLLAELEAEAEELGRIALIKNEAYNFAAEEVSRMRDKVDGLEQRASEAQAEAEFAKRQLARIVARMYRNGTAGDPTLELFFNPEASDDLLYQLSAQDIVAERTDG